MRKCNKIIINTTIKNKDKIKTKTKGRLMKMRTIQSKLYNVIFKN
jgi:hypothetical protein